MQNYRALFTALDQTLPPFSLGRRNISLTKRATRWKNVHKLERVGNRRSTAVSPLTTSRHICQKGL